VRADIPAAIGYLAVGLAAVIVEVALIINRRRFARALIDHWISTAAGKREVSAACRGLLANSPTCAIKIRLDVEQPGAMVRAYEIEDLPPARLVGA
jgi:hypothetical protein